MPNFSRLIHRQVRVADRLTKSLQARVTHLPYASDDGWGKETPDRAKVLTAVVENKLETVRNAAGEEITSDTTLTFTFNLLVDLRDKFSIPDKLDPSRVKTYPVLSVEGIQDKDGYPYVTKVILGSQGV